MNPYWAVAQLVPNREKVALHFLALNQYEVFYPRIREQRIVRHRRVVRTPPLFPGYCFLRVVFGWRRARWSPGIRAMIFNGEGPAVVPDAMIEEIRKRERGGFVVLPERSLRPGDAVRIWRGAFAGHLALFAGQSGHERVAVLLSLFGARQKVTLPKDDIEPLAFTYGHGNRNLC
jgi:transcriptional antiterminator RfaH